MLSLLLFYFLVIADNAIVSVGVYVSVCVYVLVYVSVCVYVSTSAKLIKKNLLLILCLLLFV